MINKKEFNIIYKVNLANKDTFHTNLNLKLNKDLETL